MQPITLDTLQVTDMEGMVDGASSMTKTMTHVEAYEDRSGEEDMKEEAGSCEDKHRQRRVLC
jgi:hypothetical protein